MTISAALDSPAPPPDSTGVEIVPVAGRRALKQFIQLPRRLYHGLPGFVPPLDFERRGMLAPGKSAFYEEGRAQFFLALRDGRPVGRISAQVDPVTQAAWDPETREPVGLFGALDAIDDAGVVAALIDAARGWLAAQGIRRMVGPYVLNPNGEPGLLIEGQTERAMLMSPWHPAWLGAHVEASGLRKVKDLLAYELAVGPEAEAALSQSRTRLESFGGGISVRRMRTRGPGLAEDAAIMAEIYNDAWHDNWGFVPITRAETRAMARELKPLIRPEHMVLVERDGRPIAVTLVLPNLYDIVGDLGGSPSPIGWLRFARRLLGHRFRSGRVILLGVRAELRGSLLGAVLPSLMIGELMTRGREMPLRSVELGWILEDNVAMRRLIEQLVPAPSKRFRLYEGTTG